MKRRNAESSEENGLADSWNRKACGPHEYGGEVGNEIREAGRVQIVLNIGAPEKELGFCSKYLEKRLETFECGTNTI